jgi:hypothetical protein
MWFAVRALVWVAARNQGGYATAFSAVACSCGPGAWSIRIGGPQVIVLYDFNVYAKSGFCCAVQVE